jgi:hypothetical protein
MIIYVVFIAFLFGPAAIAYCFSTYLAVGVFLYCLAGIIRLRYFDYTGLGGFLMMMSDHRHRNIPMVIILLLIAWIFWPLTVYDYYFPSKKM